MSKEAFEIYKEYELEVEKRLCDEEKWECMRAYGGKNVGTMLRIAGLFHVAKTINTPPEEVLIEAQTMRDAIKIIECLNIHAEKIFKESGTDEKFEITMYVLKKLLSFDCEEITKSELYQSCRKKLKNPNELDQLLNTLIERNYIITQKTPSTIKGGKPSIKIQINSKINKNNI
jgi:hypothetical protein